MIAGKKKEEARSQDDEKKMEDKVNGLKKRIGDLEKQKEGLKG